MRIFPTYGNIVSPIILYHFLLGIQVGQFQKSSKNFGGKLGIDELFLGYIFLETTSWDSCELKLFDRENFRGSQTEITKEKKRIRRGHTQYSLQTLGSCCWNVYRYFFLNWMYLIIKQIQIKVVSVEENSGSVWSQTKTWKTFENHWKHHFLWRGFLVTYTRGGN